MNRKTRFLALLIIQLAARSWASESFTLINSSATSNSTDPKSSPNDLSQSETARQQTVSTQTVAPSKGNLTIFNVDKQVAYEERGKIKVSSSNYGIRVIKAPTLESLQLDGQRLKELNSKLNEKLKFGGKAVKSTTDPTRAASEASKKEKSPVKVFGRQPKAKQMSQASNSDKKPLKNETSDKPNHHSNQQQSNRIPSNRQKANRFHSNQHQSNEKSNLVRGLLPVQSAQVGDRVKQSAVSQMQGYLPLQQQLNYQYGHHIDHIGNAYQINDPHHLYPNDIGFRTQQNYQDLLNDKIEKTKDHMKYNLIHHHHRVKPNFDQINMEPLKVHLNPYLKDMHKPNKLWGHPKWPPSKFNQAAYNKKQRPKPGQLKKQLEYRKNPYPHLNRFRHLVKPIGKSQGSKLDNIDYHQKDRQPHHKHSHHEHKDDLDDFDKEFDEGRKFPSFNTIANLDQLPSIDFRTLAPVYVKNIDFDSFYKLNPYFTLPLPHM